MSSFVVWYCKILWHKCTLIKKGKKRCLAGSKAALRQELVTHGATRVPLHLVYRCLHERDSRCPPPSHT